MDRHATGTYVRKKWLAAGTIGVLLLLAASPLAWDRWIVEKRIAPEAFDVDQLKKFNRSKVRPHLARLIDELEAGRLVGAQADQFRAELDQADEIKGGPDRPWTFYWLYENPAAKDVEGEPKLVVCVQNKFGHIFRCGVSVPIF
jgi:hypothetical protein